MLRGAYCIWERDLKVFWRNLIPELVTVVAFPLTFFLAFALGLQNYILDIEGVPYAIFVVPGLISMTAAMGAFDDGAWGLWFHRVVQGTINEYRCNPINVYDIIFGKIISGFTIACLKGSSVGIILFLLVDFPFRASFVLSYSLFILLGSMIFSCLGTICGTVIDKPENLGRLEAAVIWPFIFLAGLFFPLSVYPEKLLPYIKLVPTTALFDGARAALLAGEMDIGYLIILFFSVCFSFMAAVIIFERKISQ
jgi:lipooligosaccharide transport system permease protein